MSNCTVHNRPGRCAFGTLVVCDWCDAGYPAEGPPKAARQANFEAADVLAAEIERSVWAALESDKLVPWSDAPIDFLRKGIARSKTEPLDFSDDEDTSPGDDGSDFGGMLMPLRLRKPPAPLTLEQAEALITKLRRDNPEIDRYFEWHRRNEQVNEIVNAPLRKGRSFDRIEYELPPVLRHLADAKVAAISDTYADEFVPGPTRELPDGGRVYTWVRK